MWSNENRDFDSYRVISGVNSFTLNLMRSLQARRHEIELLVLLCHKAGSRSAALRYSADDEAAGGRGGAV